MWDKSFSDKNWENLSPEDCRTKNVKELLQAEGKWYFNENADLVKAIRMQVIVNMKVILFLFLKYFQKYILNAKGSNIWGGGLML